MLIELAEMAANFCLIALRSSFLAALSAAIRPQYLDRTTQEAAFRTECHPSSGKNRHLSTEYNDRQIGTFVLALQRTVMKPYLISQHRTNRGVRLKKSAESPLQATRKSKLQSSSK